MLGISGERMNLPGTRGAVWTVVSRVLIVAALLLGDLVLPVEWCSAAAFGGSGAVHKKAVTHKHGAASTSARHSSAKRTRSSRSRRTRHPLSPKKLAQSRKLQRAFVASSQLRPMAQQLVQSRTAGAYGGVTAYAHTHTGEAASAAYLALGHAYLTDRRYPEATTALHQSKTQGQSLADYADFLGAQADLQANKLPEAEALLNGFIERYPDSIFVASVPVLEANLLLQQGDPQGAIRKLQAHASEPIANHADFQFAMAKAQQMAGQQDEAAKLYRHVYLGFPLSGEAQQAKTLLASSGMSVPLTVAERQARADALYVASRFSDAMEEYGTLASDPLADESLRNRLRVAAAACELKLKHLSREAAERLPDTSDEAGARRLYLLMELARNRDDGEMQRAIVAQMESRFGSSPWLAEALYSSGNMYLLRKDYPYAIQFYGELAKRFPLHSYAPSAHWRAGWLNYRIGQYAEAARLFDEQIAVYAGGKEIPSALYWRGRIYETQEHKPEFAAAYYRTVSDTFLHYFYAELARQRLAKLNNVTPTVVATLSGVRPAAIPELTDDVPEDDPHVVKAKLLANAGLNEYIPAEIAAGDGSEEWGGFAEAQIYSSYGETFRAMHVMKRAISFYTSAPISAIPLTYWRILYPQPYWSTIKAEAAKNGLDPYMVAALIRQESEFNPGAVSRSNAYGLMQMLPSVGKQMAKAEGIRHFNTSDLLNPEINIRLGTRYLRQTLARFGNQPELAFAAYNAGDERVVDWRAAGNFHDVDEFVESIPFTETRDYVQAIVRNEDIYRQLDSSAAHASEITPQINMGPGRPGAPPDGDD